MEQRDEKNLGAENLQRIAQRVNGIAEKIVALAQGSVAAARQVLESEAFREALQAALQEIQTDQARPLGSFAEVAAHMEGAYGQNRYQVGDIIQMNHDDFGLIKWRVIGVDVDRAAGHRHTLTVAMERAETYHWFSEPSKEHPFGSNNYPGSAIRFYLNNEFFRGIPEEDAETLLTTCRPCTDHGEASSTCDLVWLLSAAEVGFKGNGIPCEGEPYPWYAQGDSAEQRRAVDMDGDEAAYWLRTPNAGNGDVVRYVSPDGSLGISDACSSSGVLAACVIGSSDSSAPVGASERRDAHE